MIRHVTCLAAVVATGAALAVMTTHDSAAGTASPQATPRPQALGRARRAVHGDAGNG